MVIVKAGSIFIPAYLFGGDSTGVLGLLSAAPPLKWQKFSTTEWKVESVFKHCKNC